MLTTELPFTTTLPLSLTVARLPLHLLVRLRLHLDGILTTLCTFHQGFDTLHFPIAPSALPWVDPLQLSSVNALYDRPITFQPYMRIS